MSELGDNIEQIMLNAIRWRDQRGNAGTITKEDRRWLLRYIDRHVSTSSEGLLAVAADKALYEALGPGARLWDAHSVADRLLNAGYVVRKVTQDRQPSGGE